MKRFSIMGFSPWHYLQLALLIVTWVYFGVQCHPQCLDFKPPFQPKKPLKFCPQYTDFGCCTVGQDQNLRERYNQIRSNLSNEDANQCGGYLRELLCQKCSPYAAHIYDAEVTLRAREFPGLCSDYCQLIHSQCKVIIGEISSEPALLTAVSLGVKAFCQHTSLTDTDYCYPHLLTNDVLNRRVSIVQITSEGCLCVEEFAKGLRNPVFARYPEDGSHRLFIGEQLGLIHVYYVNGTKESEPFLDIADAVLETTREGDERGLLGIAFHPRVKSNGRFYVYYSTSVGTDDDKIRISEFRFSETNPSKADPTTEKVVLEVNQPYWNHNGGEILFGDDGYLYLFVGDGGAGGDPHFYSQNKTVFLGKVLRIDVDVEPPSTEPYRIPPDNPFVNETGTLPEIYAYGVRNIWRCGKDRGDPYTGEGKGRIICGDVGQSAFEEIDLLVKGGNYGWNAREGLACFNQATCNKIGKEELPIHAYPHSVGKSVTGGHIYRGCHNPNLNGFYIYGDFMKGRLFRLLEDPLTGEWKNKELNMCGNDTCVYPLTGNYLPQILSFGEDEDGEIYMLSTDRASTANTNGVVYRFVDPARRGNPAECISARNPTHIYHEADRQQTTTSPNVRDRADGRWKQNAAPVLHIKSIRVKTCRIVSGVLCKYQSYFG